MLIRTIGSRYRSDDVGIRCHILQTLLADELVHADEHRVDAGGSAVHQAEHHAQFCVT